MLCCRASGVAVGDWVTLTANSPSDGSLINALNGGAAGFVGGSRDGSIVGKARALRTSAQITAIEKHIEGWTVVSLSRHIQADLPLSTSPELHR